MGLDDVVMGLRQRPKVVYILAWGRSGSTILDNALGAIEGFFSAGEVRYLWERGVSKGWRCGCGLPVPECPVWSSVLARVGDRSEGAALARAVESWQSKLVRVRHTWRLLRQSRAGGVDRAVADYAQVLGRLFDVVAEVTEADVIVDSSKRPSDAAMLRLVPDIDVYAIHLVRDPRAVAHSWSKRNSRVGRHGVVASTVSWVVWNFAAEAVRRRMRGRSMFVRYEDFVCRPREVIEQVLGVVGEGSRPPPTLEGNKLELRTNHTVSGNPSRFRTGTVEVRPDARWLSELGTLRWFVATLLAAPLLRRYRYPVRRPGPQEQPPRSR